MEKNYQVKYRIMEYYSENNERCLSGARKPIDKSTRLYQEIFKVPYPRPSPLQIKIVTICAAQVWQKVGFSVVKGRNGFLHHFQQLRSYQDEKE